MYCQTCGAVNREDTKFCFKCGDKLERGIDPSNSVNNFDNSSNSNINISDIKEDIHNNVEEVELEYIEKAKNSGSNGKNQSYGLRINKSIKERIKAVKTVTGLLFDYQAVDYLLDFHRRHATPNQLKSYAVYDGVLNRNLKLLEEENTD